MFLLVFNLVLIAGLVAHISRLYKEKATLREDVEARDRLIDHLYNELEKR